MNDLTKQEKNILTYVSDKVTALTSQIPLCPKCNNKLSDTAAVFWDKEMTKIVEWRAGCSNIKCDYIMVKHNE